MKYDIKGDNMPVAIITLADGESLVTEAGAMSWMSPNVEMSTNARGGIGKAFGRMFSGESMFLNTYTARGGSGLIACASCFPGRIVARRVSPGHDIVLQKSAFLACEESVQTSVFVQRRLGAGFFGGEGFIMQRVSGDGIVFCEFDGHVVEYELQQGQSIIVDTGNLAAMDATCQVDIQSVGGLANTFLGGEGFFNTVVTGPGHIWLQTMPISTVARAISPFIHVSSSD